MPGIIRQHNILCNKDCKIWKKLFIHNIAIFFIPFKKHQLQHLLKDKPAPKDVNVQHSDSRPQEQHVLDIYLMCFE